MLLLAAREGIQTTVLPMPLTGGTGPITLAGSAALQNAECLFALVFSQVVTLGAPFVFGSSACLLDMRTGRIAYAAPESLLLRAAASQMARFYGLPSYAGLAPDALAIDVQTGAERMLGYCAGLASGISLVLGVGYVGHLSVSCEQLVIDHDLWQIARRFFDGLVVDDERLALAAIDRVGPGGNYIEDEHTLRWLRREPAYYSNLVARPASAEIDRGMFARARERMQEILETHVPRVSEATRVGIGEYVAARRAELLPGAERG
jgi:trimethylamine--corrinoid protein Co-methyltransferase